MISQNDEYLPLSNIQGTSGTEMLKNMAKDQLDILKDMISEIDDEIERRKKISKAMIIKLDDQITDIENMIMDFPKLNPMMQQGQGIGPELIKSMTELRKQKINVEELKVEEQINLWKDIANLKREQRILIREFRERQTKGDLLDDLIGE